MKEVKKMEDKEMYWNLNEILTYDKNFNFINSKRGSGKTYTLQKWLIKQFIKKQRETVYITQFISELDDIGIKQPFTKVLENEYPNVEAVQIGHDLYLDGKIFCYGIALTEAQKIKKMSFPNVYYIMFDEYMKEQAKKNSFVKNEVDEFLSIYSTIDRYEDRVKCFFLGNTTTQYNPYHTHKAFKIPSIELGEIWTSENVLYQYYKPKQIFEDKIGKSRFAKMIANTEYGKYSVLGEFTEDTDEFIEKRSEKAKEIFNFIFNDVRYGVWRDLNEGKLYISDKYNPNMNICYTLTTTDHRENTMLTKTSKSSMLKYLSDNFRYGNVRFESQAIKKKTMEAIKMIL